MLHENELITIEEEMVINPDYVLRRFTLNNRINGLSVAISAIGAKIVSIKLDSGKHEIVTAIVDSSLQSTNGQRFEWNAHVVGLDSLLLTTNASSSQSITYQLTKDNELVLNGRFKGQQQQNLFHPFYLNLNSTASSIDGHLIHVQSSSESGEVGALLSVSGDDIPFNMIGSQPCKLSFPEDMAKTTFDVVISCLNDIVATLEYGTRRMELNLHNKANNTTVISCCRLRLRLTKDGVSLMPTHMNEFTCVYKFLW
ncbi:hypothetical protein B4U79_00190 [Dinothrombium tinctorium]|uniref:Uncharacterized protein n=1 Tax=Dinothrombium tinctorium TaxID=1965070 RepID=A0A3S3P7Y6_9ACAR|nr:hypothetical protein B4U79_00190 [Dinothrombium tinctorium]